MKRICINCNTEKVLEEYYKAKGCRDGIRPECKQCVLNKQKIYTELNKDKNTATDKKYYVKNKEVIAEKSKLRRKENKNNQQWVDKERERLKQYSLENIEKEKERLKKFRENNKDSIREYQKNYRNENKEDIAASKKEYSNNNKEKIRSRHRVYKRERLKKDPQFKLRENMSNFLSKSLKQRNLNKCKAGWQSLVGYTAEQLKLHLEQRFTPEMSWENYGSYWHIDHIEPQSWFNYDSMDHPAFKACWALDNLQPLEAKANMSKSNRWKG